MSASAVVSLRRAIRDALTADTSLNDMLGGPAIYDGVLRTAVPPYVSFGDVSLTDISGIDSRAAEQVLAIDVWSDQHGAREALTIAAEIERILRAAPLVLADHALVDLSFAALQTKREDQGRLQRATLRFRAVTQPN